MVSEPSSRGTANRPAWAILSAFADRRFTIVGLWLLGLAGIGLSLVMPIQVGRLTQLFGGGEAASWPPVLRAIVYLVAAQLGLSTISYIQTRSEVSLRESAIRNLTLRVYARIIRFGADFFRNQEVERINTRATENANRVCMFWSAALFAVPLAVGSLVVVGGAMLLDNWLLGLCMVVLSALSGYFVFFDRQIQAVNQETRDTWETIRAGTSEVVAGVAEIRNHHAFGYALENLGRAFGAYQAVMERCGRMMAMFRSMDPLLATVQKGALFAVGAALCIGGSSLAHLWGPMTWGQVIKFMLLAQLFQESVSQLASYLLQWRMTRESERRIADYLGRPCAFQDAGGEQLPGESTGVAYDRVSVVSESGRCILRDVTLHVPAGQHVAVCGPSGCGKSTMLGALVHGVEPAAGRCMLGSVPLGRYDLPSLGRGVGLVPQNPVLFNTTVRQNLLLSLRRRSQRCIEDDQGAIDVERLAHVGCHEDLDRELVSVVKLVALDVDLICKCLDGPLPGPGQLSQGAGSAAAAIRSRIEPLRQRLARQADALPPGSVVRFDRSACFPGTVGENLLGPGAAPAPEQLALLCKSLQGQAALDDLLQVGYRQVVTEQDLAARASMDRPGLMELLPRRPSPGDNVDGLITAGRSLSNLPAADRQALLAVAFASDMDQAGEFSSAGDFASRILAARAAILKDDPDTRRGWDGLDPGAPGPVQGFTLRENLLRGRPNGRLHGAQARVDELVLGVLRDEGLSDAAVLLGLEFGVGEGGRFLSGGQRQKVAIARIVLKNPSLLLLDEATASMDESSQTRILDLVRTRFAGRTVVSISHRLSAIRDHDRIVVMDRGQVVQQGGYQELAGQEGLFRTLMRQERGEPFGMAPRAEPGVSPPPAPSAVPPETPSLRLQHQVAMAGLFRRLKGEQLAFVASAMKVVRCPRGEVLFRRGDVGRDLYVILDGQVEFFVEPRPGEGGGKTCTVVNSMGPGGVFGELAAFGQGRRTVGARAAGDTTLGILDRDDLVKLIYADPKIAVELLGTVSTYLARTADAANARAVGDVLAQ